MGRVVGCLVGAQGVKDVEGRQWAWGNDTMTPGRWRRGPSQTSFRGYEMMY